MKPKNALIEGRLIKRYKRFLADIELENGKIVTAHTPNTGSMKGCNIPGSKVWLKNSANPKRKYPLSWELVEAEAGSIVGINTLLANHLVREGIETGFVSELQGYTKIRREMVYGKEKSRIDLFLEANGRAVCYVEVKNVTLVEKSVAYFPDAVTTRGAKHLRELIEMVAQGNRAVMLFCIQREDAHRFQPADDIDIEYGKTLRKAISLGVEVMAYSCQVSALEIVLANRVSVVCPDLD